MARVAVREDKREEPHIYRTYRCASCGLYIGAATLAADPSTSHFWDGCLRVPPGYHENAGGVFVRSKRPPRRRAGYGMADHNILSHLDAMLNNIEPGTIADSSGEMRFSKGELRWVTVADEVSPVVVKCYRCLEYNSLLR